jgi:hypothetical protein
MPYLLVLFLESAQPGGDMMDDEPDVWPPGLDDLDDQEPDLDDD